MGDVGACVVGVVRQQGFGRDVLEQRFDELGVMVLAWAQDKAKRVAKRVTERVDFGVGPTSGNADGLWTTFFWAPAEA